ncbi:hypothetical protein GCM10010182_27840 [Actinomadura cremea]|nr:hypothetical protein GCM10010182_27840 [Actinomadura cremea]
MLAKLAAKPRLLSGACSRPTSIAPPHSPPTARPCTTRSTISSTGAATPSYTPHTLTSPELLRRALARTRERGFAVAVQEFSLGTVSVAAPVLSADRSHALAAISVVVHSSRANIARLGPAVRTAAMGAARHASHRASGAHGPGAG